jgi:uncharacterized lipoprotein YddW (UPF0748 family)
MTQELRGVWLTNIDSDVLFSQSRLSQSLERLKLLNFNTIYPTIWNWGYTLYPSDTARSAIGVATDPDPGFRQRDMLAEAVRYGHQQGLAVIPWFEFGLMAPADSALVRRHPHWVTQRRNGEQIVKEGRYDRVWLNPFHPEVQQFILQLIGEMVANYAVDGIQLDDHFGLPVELGYDAYTVQLYRKEHGGKKPPANPQDAAWMRWRADKLTQLMAKVFETVKSRNANCLVALSPNSQDFSYRHYLQDWRTWERSGLVEELILQVYRDDLLSFATELVRPEIVAARAHIPVGVGILTGLKDHPVPIAQIQQQVQIVREKNLAGVSFFFYETLGDRDADFLELFPNTIERPNLLQGWHSPKPQPPN